MVWGWSTQIDQPDESLFTSHPTTPQNHRWSVASTTGTYPLEQLPQAHAQQTEQPSQSWWLKRLFARNSTATVTSHTTELEYMTDDTMADLGQLDDDGRVRVATLDMSADDIDLDEHDSNQKHSKYSRYCINPFQWNGAARDAYAAILFIGHIGGMLAVAYSYGILLVNSEQWQVSLSQMPPTGLLNTQTGMVYFTDIAGFSYFIILIIASCIGAVWSLIWLKFAQHTYTIMNLTFGLCLALYVTISIEFMFIRLLPLGCGFIVFGVLQLFYVAAVKHKLPFTHAILKTNVGVLHRNPNVLHAAYKLTFIALAWYTFWAFTFAATLVQTYSVTINGPTTDPMPGFVLFFTLVSLYWSTHVIQISAQMITSGVIATYMLKPTSHISTLPFIRNVFRFSVFGAICSAAFLTPITEGFRQLVKQTKKWMPFLIPRFISRLADKGFEYSNHYAVTALACEPSDWTTLSRGTFKMIKESQLVAECVNRDVTSTVTTFAGFAGGMMAAVCAGTWASTIGFEFQQQITLLAFLVSWCTSSIIMSVCQASISTTLMCWATDDAALQGNRPEITAVLNEIVEPSFSRKTSVSRSFYMPAQSDEVDVHVAQTRLKPIDEIEELMEEKTNDVLPPTYSHNPQMQYQYVIPIWNQSEKGVKARGLDTTHGF